MWSTDLILKVTNMHLYQIVTSPHHKYNVESPFFLQIMLFKQYIVLIIIPAVVHILIAVPLQQGHWNATHIDNTDVLYYWEANVKYTYEEAKEVCRRKNMLSRIHLNQIFKQITEYSGKTDDSIF